MDKYNNLIKQINIINESIQRQRKARIDSLLEDYSPENKLKKLQNTINTIERPTKQSYDYLLSQRKDFHTELLKTVDDLERMKSSVTLVKPIDYINGIIPTQIQYNEICESINKINWVEINDSITHARTILNYSFINLFPQSDEFTKAIYDHVCKINDDELNEIFTESFLYKITKDWWIFPRFSLEEYKEISKIKDSNSFNNLILNDYYFNPELIEELIYNWDIKNEYRTEIIEQAYFNYLHGNYETCVILLMLQIEGLMKEKIDYDASDIDLRIKIQDTLNENSETDDVWKSFLNKANAEFILRVVKPLYDKVNFEFHIGEIKRHEIAHMGLVDSDQMGALKLFLILDTVIYILDDLDEIN